jgi:hypothetical protein
VHILWALRLYELANQYHLTATRFHYGDADMNSYLLPLQSISGSEALLTAESQVRSGSEYIVWM